MRNQRHQKLRHWLLVIQWVMTKVVISPSFLSVSTLPHCAMANVCIELIL